MPLKWEHPKCQEKGDKERQSTQGSFSRLEEKNVCWPAAVRLYLSVNTILPDSQETWIREQLTHFKFQYTKLLKKFLEIFSLFLGYTSWTEE